MLDRCDAGGWLLLLTGCAVMSMTLLAPAWVDVRQLADQRNALDNDLRRIHAQVGNYIAFTQAIQDGDPILLQRLAWHQLHLKPAGAIPLDGLGPADQLMSQTPDQWLRPVVYEPAPDIAPLPPLPDTRFTRLILGPARPWVLALGAWLVLFGLLTHVSKPRDLAATPT